MAVHTTHGSRRTAYGRWTRLRLRERLVAPADGRQWRHPLRADGSSVVPQLTVDGFGTVEVPAGKRLVRALEEDAGVDVLHACGGNARCTTCRVEFVAGEPATTTAAEQERLAAKGLSGVRLSCQILCDHDMTVRAISRLTGSGRADAGPTPADHIEPPPVWQELAS